MELADFDAYLARCGAAASTRRVYVAAVRAWTASGQDAEAFVRASLGGPQGTATVRRAALRAWHRWRGLPEPRVSVRGSTRPPPPAAPAVDLRAYHDRAERAEDPTVRAVLHVLPHVTLSLEALCALPAGAKLPAEAEAHLEEHRAFLDGPWLFPGRAGPIHPETVRSAFTRLKLTGLRALRRGRPRS